MSYLSKKVKALDPHLRYPDVGPGEELDRSYRQCESFLQGYNKNLKVPSPRAPPADDLIVNPGQSFLGKFSGKCRK
jgi:hypothetical protein